MIVAQEQTDVQHRWLNGISRAREQTDALFDVLRPGALYDRPIPERHRFIFYLGHLEAFDWNLLHENVLGLKSFHPEFDRLFAFGIDPVGGGLPSDQPSDWPSAKAVHDYVAGIRSALDEKLAKVLSGSQQPTQNEFSLDTLLNVAVEHRLMHAETLTYMLHQLATEKKVQQAGMPVPMLPPATARMIEIPAGPATLGLARAAGSFGWDNEYEAHTTFVPSFEVDQHMVTNRQYLDFILAGGYETRALWSDDDWTWKTANDISHPAFWLRKDEDNDNGWAWKAMFGEVPLPPDWPVYVSHAEASAYARWAGKSLPTEQEWHRAAYGAPDGAERYYPWGSRTPNAKLGNFDFAAWDPAPVHAHAAGQSAFGVRGMLGNGWEWTSTVFAPFAGFKAFPFYPGYSADFFDGKHFVMKGGSARTAACMLRPTFRNWFQTHYQYVYAGFRCVQR
jgi:ergothioneine biosynthesis protein EgtB